MGNKGTGPLLGLYVNGGPGAIRGGMSAEMVSIEWKSLWLGGPANRIVIKPYKTITISDGIMGFRSGGSKVRRVLDGGGLVSGVI